MTKPTILVVDDDAQVLRAVSRDLRSRYGKEYRILSADSGASALELMARASERGDPVALVISDQRMPGMDGVTLLSHVSRTHPRTKRVLLTAYADTEAAIAAINESRLHYYLLKPWDPPEARLYPVVDDMLEDWRAGYRPGYGGIRVVGDRWSAQGHTIRDFLARNQVPYVFVDVESSDEGAALLEGARPEDLPLVILPAGARLHAPSLPDLAGKIGLAATPKEEFYDLAIVGAGPGGLASAVYAGSEGLRTVLIESEAPGGQAGTSSRIENYLGFPAGLSGEDLARRAVAQARRFGVEILTPQCVVDLGIDGPYRRLRTEDGADIAAHVVMLAVGVHWKRLHAEGADDFIGSGVYYGAALTEATHVEGRTVWMVGAGNSAGQAAMHFKDHADRVIMVVRGDSLESRMSRYLVDRIRNTDNIEVRLCTEVLSCRGSGRLQGLTVRDIPTGAIDEVDAEYLFVFIGAAPRTDWLADRVARDDRGFILTGPDLDPKLHLANWPLDRSPYPLETNVPGVFACGDARHASVKRVASAVGEGAVSVSFVHRILAER